MPGGELVLGGGSGSALGIPSATVLVVDDEESYREALASGLGRAGFRVRSACSGAEALGVVRAGGIDVVLLDIVLAGGMPGTEVYRRIRAVSAAPVIMVSALGDELDVVLGLEIGAADYIRKPYSMRELVARVNAVLRRSCEQVNSEGVLVAGPLVVDPLRREVHCRGVPLTLSRLEFDLLETLVDPPGRARTREELLDKLWADRDLADTRTLDTHVRRLRAKIELDASDPKYLVTLRGIGFRFDPEGGG